MLGLLSNLRRRTVPNPAHGAALANADFRVGWKNFRGFPAQKDERSAEEAG